MKLNPIGSNMTEVEIGNKRVLFSYRTPVVQYETETGKFHRTNKHWSSTTSRHINKYLQLLEMDGYIVTESTQLNQEELDNLIK